MRCRITLEGRVRRLCHHASDEYRSAGGGGRGQRDTFVNNGKRGKR